MPENTSTFTTNYKENICEKINDNTYLVDLSTASGKGGYIDVIFDKNIIEGTNVILSLFDK